MAVRKWYLMRKMQMATFFILAAFFISGCKSQQIEVSGRLVSYEFLNLEDYKLRYVVITKRDITQKGMAAIRAGGDFAIRIKPEVELPYWVIIKGLDNIPDASITGNSLEIADNRQAKRDMGEVYIYNKIREWSNIVGPIDIEDIVLEWETDIPNVEYYLIKIVGRVEDSGYFASAISVSGIKGNKFAFSSLSGALRNEGTHQVGDLVVVINNADLEGMYFLNIIAIRKIGEKTVEVGRSSSEMVTIIRNETI